MSRAREARAWLPLPCRHGPPERTPSALSVLGIREEPSELAPTPTSSRRRAASPATQTSAMGASAVSSSSTSEAGNAFAIRVTSSSCAATNSRNASGVARQLPPPNPNSREISETKGLPSFYRISGPVLVNGKRLEAFVRLHASEDQRAAEYQIELVPAFTRESLERRFEAGITAELVHSGRRPAGLGTAEGAAPPRSGRARRPVRGSCAVPERSRSRRDGDRLRRLNRRRPRSAPICRASRSPPSLDRRVIFTR